MTNDDEDVAALRKFVSDNRRHLTEVKKELENLGGSARTKKSTSDELVEPAKRDAASPQPVAPGQAPKPPKK